MAYNSDSGARLVIYCWNILFFKVFLSLFLAPLLFKHLKEYFFTLFMRGYLLCVLDVAICYFTEEAKKRSSLSHQVQEATPSCAHGTVPITNLTITISYCLPTDCPMSRDGRWHRLRLAHRQCWNLLNHPMTCHPNRHSLRRRSTSMTLSPFLLRLSLVLYMYVSFCCLLFVLRKSFHLYLIITFTVVPLLIWRMFTPSCKSSMRMPLKV